VATVSNIPQACLAPNTTHRVPTVLVRGSLSARQPPRHRQRQRPHSQLTIAALPRARQITYRRRARQFEPGTAGKGRPRPVLSCKDGRLALRARTHATSTLHSAQANAFSANHTRRGIRTAMPSASPWPKALLRAHHWPDALRRGHVSRLSRRYGHPTGRITCRYAELAGLRYDSRVVFDIYEFQQATFPSARAYSKYSVIRRGTGRYWCAQRGASRAAGCVVGHAALSARTARHGGAPRACRGAVQWCRCRPFLDFMLVHATVAAGVFRRLIRRQG
jgi:hypothetical protein